jgi:excinuclease ABC subunit C
MIQKDLKKNDLPDQAGVYYFKKNSEILYIGKATSLKDRIGSYFSNDLISTRGPRIVDMITLTNKIEFQVCDSVLEALILESNLIKKHSPKYNIKEKDDRSYNFVIITKENFPRVLIIRGKELKHNLGLAKNLKIAKIFGPFPNGSQLKEALKLVKKLFPHFDTKQIVTKENFLKKRKSKLNFQINLFPDVFSGKVTRQEYLKNIKNIALLFSGKKKTILKNLESEMQDLAKNLQFEKANEIKKTIFALKHIRDISLIKETENLSSINFRLESYDIAHISGTNTVGAMTVMEGNELKRSDYRKFIIKQSARGDDCACLKEILTRRLKHVEWPLPQILIVDGGRGQLNTAVKVLKENLSNENFLKINIVSVVKDDRHKATEILLSKNLNQDFKNILTSQMRKTIFLLNQETHRFAIQFHRKKRNMLK